MRWIRVLLFVTGEFEFSYIVGDLLVSTAPRIAKGAAGLMVR